MSKKIKDPNITFEDGTPAPFVQPGEPVIVLNPGVPPMGSPEFLEELRDFHERHNGPTAGLRVTKKGRKAIGK